MAAASYFSDIVAVNRTYDFILAEDETDTTEGTWIGCMLAEEEGKKLVEEGRVPFIGQRISSGEIGVNDRDPLSHLIWKQDDWRGGALVNNADLKNNGYNKGSMDAAWGTLAPGIAKNFGSDRGNTRQPIGWLMLNPHFESDADDGWTDSSSTNGTVDMQATDDFRGEITGSQSCKFTMTATNDIITQSLANPTVWQGKSITVSCYFKKSSGTNGVRLKVYDGVGTTNGTAVTSASSWTLVTVTRTVDAAATEVTITLEANDGAVTGWADDFTCYSGATTLDPVGVVATDNGAIYTAAGRIVAKLDTSTTDQFKWDAVYVHASAVATDIVVYRDQSGSPATQVYVGFGAATAYIYGTDTTWTTSTITGNGKYAVYWAVSRSTLWKSESANTIRSSTNPLNAGSWSGTTYTVDDSNRPITQLYGHDDTIFVGKEDGLWKYQRLYEDGTSADLFVNQTSEFSTQPNERHFKGGSEFLDGNLYLPLGRGGVLRTGRGAIQDISGIFTKPDVGINGVVYAMALDTKNLWTFVDDRLLSLMYDEDGKLVVHTRGDQPSVSPEALAASQTTEFNTGWVDPTADSTSTGSGNAWTGLANVKASDDSRASASASTTQTLETLMPASIVPDNATITGIQARVERYIDAGSFPLVKDNNIQLIVGGAASGDNKASASYWPQTSGSEAYATYGGSTDLWGLSPTAADINSGSFGVAIKADNAGTTTTAYVDHVQIKVYYTITTTASAALLPKAASVVTWNVSSVETPHLLGLYGGQEATDNEPYLITDCWALPDEGVAPVLDSSDLPASPTTHTWYSSRWSADSPTELKMASHIEFKLKNMDSTQAVTVKFGKNGADLDSVALGTLNGSGAVQTLYFGDASTPQESALFYDIGLYLEGTYTGTKNKREVLAFELHAWPVAELMKAWSLTVQVAGASTADGGESPFDAKTVSDTLEVYEDPAQTPRYFYLIEDFDGDGVVTSTSVTIRPGTVTRQIGPAEGERPSTLQRWAGTFQQALNQS